MTLKVGEKINSIRNPSKIMPLKTLFRQLSARSEYLHFWAGWSYLHQSDYFEPIFNLKKYLSPVFVHLADIVLDKWVFYSIYNV